MPASAGWLKKAVIHHNKPKFSIVDRMRVNLAGYEEGRCRKTLHASDVTKPEFCPRKEALLDLQQVTHGEKSFVRTAQRVTYDMGLRTEEQMVHHWAKEYVVGNWRCEVCNNQRTMSPHPLSCDTHKGNFWRYIPPTFFFKKYGISGTVDILFDVGAPLYLMTELKTLAADDFKEIVTPLPEHQIRTKLYLRLMAESESPYKNRINLHEARVLYVSRGYGKKNAAFGDEILPFQEFEVQRDDQALLPILNKALQLKVFREDGLMPSGICATALDKTAKACSACKECFSGQHPAQQPELV